MLRALAVLLVLFATACGLAEDERDEKNKRIYLTFYDKRFETFCLERFDTDSDGRISRYEAQRVRTIECPERGIASLSDIREFFNLQRLDCRGNDIASLDLSACTLLEELDCSSNDLGELDLDGLGGLRRLDCAANRLPRLDLHSAASLAQLDCRGNALTTLDLASCSASLRADVRGNAALTTVYCLAGQSIAADGQTTLVVR